MQGSGGTLPPQLPRTTEVLSGGGTAGAPTAVTITTSSSSSSSSSDDRPMLSPPLKRARVGTSSSLCWSSPSYRSSTTPTPIRMATTTASTTGPGLDDDDGGGGGTDEGDEEDALKREVDREVATFNNDPYFLAVKARELASEAAWQLALYVLDAALKAAEHIPDRAEQSRMIASLLNDRGACVFVSLCRCLPVS